MKLSNNVKQRFVKDWKLPFQVVQEPFFSYALEELEEHFGTEEKFNMFTDVIERTGGEEGFYTESNKVKNTLIQKIQAQEAYSKLQSDKLEEYNIDQSKQVKQQNIYTMENVNRTFISLDLKHANFNVMKMYDPSLTLGFDNYQEMVGSVTDFEYFKKSKYLRQVIFGNMLPKKQQKLQKWVISKLVEMLNIDVGIDMTDFVSASADEVLFAVSPDNIEQFVDMVQRKLINNSETSKFADWVRIEAFTLKSIGDKKFFVKENAITGDVEFKGIPSFLFMQVYKKFTGKPEVELDKVFYHEGYMAVFKEGPFDEHL